jgi:glutamyl-tRNA synthetase
MDLTDGGTIAWIVGALFAIVVAVFAIWVGLRYANDEEIVFQSNNADKHREIARRLLAEGKAYRDFTPKEEVSDKTVKEAIVERARTAEKKHRANPYRGTSSVESDTRAANGEPYAIRLKVAETWKTAFEDAVFQRLAAFF